jgi:hypothetical protein
MADPVPPASPTQYPIRAAWLAFADSVAALLVPQPDDRPLDQYLVFRDHVLEMARSDAFLDALNAAWPVYTDGKVNVDIGTALVLELSSFPRAVEVANKAATSDTEKQSWLRKLLGKASTVAGSVDDILETLPKWAKAIIKLFREVVDLFHGKD